MGKEQIRNQELYEKLTNLVMKAFILLDERVKDGEKFSRRTVEEISVSEEGELLLVPLGYRDYYTKPDFSEFIFRYRDELTQLPEWTSVLECLSRDEIIDNQMKYQIRPPFGGFRLDELGLLNNIIRLSINEKAPFHFELDIFNSVYNEVERYFYSDTVTRESFCLLLGFDSEAEEIDLGHGVKIRRISKEEIVELWRESTWFRALVEQNEIAFSINVPLKYVLQVIIEAPKIRDKEEIKVASADILFEKVVCAMRLFKEGWIDYPFVREKHSSMLSSGVSYGKSRAIPSVPMGLSYKLTNNEVEDFKIFYKRVKKKIDCSKITLKRFNETYRRVSVEDKLVDYMISFESLYLTDEDISEMGYKLAHRASLLLYREETKRKQTFLEMKKAYSLRSKIVHGKKIKSITIPELKKEYNLPEFVQKIEEHLRSSIRIFLEKQKISWTDLMFEK